MKRAAIVGLVILLLVVAAVVYAPRTIRGIQLRSARDRWESASVGDYTWRIDTGCFGLCSNGEPVTIVVRDGRVVRASGDHASADVRRAVPSTVEELFERVDRMRGSDGYAVSFDADLGFPLTGSFDPSRNTIDEEWGFTVRSFERD